MPNFPQQPYGTNMMMPNQQQQQFMTGMPGGMPMMQPGMMQPGMFATGMNPMMGGGFGGPMGGMGGGGMPGGMGGGMGGFAASMNQPSGPQGFGGGPAAMGAPVASGPGPKQLESFQRDGFNVLGRQAMKKEEDVEGAKEFADLFSLADTKIKDREQKTEKFDYSYNPPAASSFP